MALTERLTADLTTAMKARDGDAVATLRMAIAAVKNLRVSEGHRGDVTDDEALQLLAREAKKRTEAAEAYERAGRAELAAKELRELEILRRYLPAQLAPEELAAIVDEEVRAAGAASPGDLGRVMSAVMPRVQGRADGRAVSAAVRARLAGQEPG
jgi:uncharacterized protein YqeY